MWLFEEKAIKHVRAAYRAVRRGAEPLLVRIDKEPWTLRDLYLYHPFGKDPDFWDKLIMEIKDRASMREGVYQDGPVPKEIYEAFVDKERKVIEKLLDEEEKLVKKSSKNAYFIGASGGI